MLSGSPILTIVEHGKQSVFEIGAGLGNAAADRILDQPPANPYARPVRNSSNPPWSAGLAKLAPAYDAAFCDVWGVIHNGAQAGPRAVEALIRFRQAGGRVVLITNAPRTRTYVIQQMDELGVDRGAYDEIVTSGDVARELLAARGEARLFHVGNEVHRRLYNDLPVALVDEESCEVICCTGLFDDVHETPEDYVERMQRWRARDVPMLCVNPDIVVERDGRLIWCAGALARRYRELGGTTEIVGKPFAPVYTAAFDHLAALGPPVDPRQVLVIGDGAETDLRGADRQQLDAVFVTGGVHASEFGSRAAPSIDAVHEFLSASGVGATALMRELAW